MKPKPSLAAKRHARRRRLQRSGTKKRISYGGQIITLNDFLWASDRVWEKNPDMTQRMVANEIKRGRQKINHDLLRRIERGYPLTEYHYRSQHAISLLRRALNGEVLRPDKTVSMKHLWALIDGGYLYDSRDLEDFNYAFRITPRGAFAIMDME